MWDALPSEFFLLLSCILFLESDEEELFLFIDLFRAFFIAGTGTLPGLSFRQ